MICPNCRKDIPEDVRFCRYCGHPIQGEAELTRQAFNENGNTMPAPPEEAPDGSQRCPKCGQVVPEGKRFCGFCGQALTPLAVASDFDEHAATIYASQVELPPPPAPQSSATPAAVGGTRMIDESELPYQIPPTSAQAQAVRGQPTAPPPPVSKLTPFAHRGLPSWLWWVIGGIVAILAFSTLALLLSGLPQKLLSTTRLQDLPTATSKTSPTLPLSTTATETAKSEIACNAVTLISETIPDNSVFPPGDAFIKTWTVQNTGSCTWTSNYTLVFVGGDRIGTESPIPIGKTVFPGEQLTLEVNLQAPQQEGNYEAYWKLQDENNQVFGWGDQNDQAFWVRILVQPTPSSLLENKSAPLVLKFERDKWNSLGEACPDGDGRSTYLTMISGTAYLKATVFIDPQWRAPYLVFWHKWSGKRGELFVDGENYWFTTGLNNWVKESIDLSPFKGLTILIRFWIEKEEDESADWDICDAQVIPDYQP